MSLHHDDAALVEHICATMTAPVRLEMIRTLEDIRELPEEGGIAADLERSILSLQRYPHHEPRPPVNRVKRTIADQSARADARRSLLEKKRNGHPFPPRRPWGS